MKGLINRVVSFFDSGKIKSRFFVVYDEEDCEYNYMETVWSKKEVESIKKYDWKNWQETGIFNQNGFKWKVVSEHKSKIEAEKAHQTYLIANN